MDFLKSLRIRKKKNSKDATRNSKEQKQSAEKNKSLKLVKKSKTKNGKQKKSKREKGKQERTTTTNTDFGNLSTNIFDPDTFTFQLESTVNPEATNHTSAQTQAYESFAAHVTSMGASGLAKEYLEVLIPFSPVGYFERKIFDQHTEFKKNRYKDIICNDKTRVILNDGYPGDYIHANYLKGTNPLYILTQGPMKDTILDLWRMVLQENVAAICMLCENIEDGQTKCEPYIPEKDGQSFTIDEITVMCTAYTNPDPHTQLRMLTVAEKKTGRTHKLCHYKIVTWPDKSIPQSNFSILRTHRCLRKMVGPVVVHCSAGVGRTGTFVAIEVGIQCLLNGKALKPVELVKAIRHCRLLCVQMDTQYLMLIETILDMGVAFKYIEDSKLLDGVETFKKQTAEYYEAHPPPKGRIDPTKNKRSASRESAEVDCEAPQQAQVPPPNPVPVPPPAIPVAPAPLATIPAAPPIPAAPVIPVIPVAPAIPMTPATPAPAAPMVPTISATHLTPAAPAIPAVPVAHPTPPTPPTPVTPASPAIPAAPAAPFKPITAQKSTNPIFIKPPATAPPPAAKPITPTAPINPPKPVVPAANLPSKEPTGALGAKPVQRKEQSHYLA